MRDQTCIVIKIAAGPGGSGQARVLAACAELLDWLGLPARVQDFPADVDPTQPFYVKDSGVAARRDGEPATYLWFIALNRVVEDRDADGNVIKSWNRGLHVDLVVAAIDYDRDELVAAMKARKKTAVGTVVAVADWDTPADMLARYGATAPRVWRHSNGVAFMLGSQLQAPQHIVAGEEQAGGMGDDD